MYQTVNTGLVTGYIENSTIIVLMNYNEEDLESGTVKEFKNTQWTP